jgi:hypothetical protein
MPDCDLPSVTGGRSVPAGHGSWVFTFGPDHRLRIHDDYAAPRGTLAPVEGAGLSLAGRYVLLPGTEEHTRQRFVNLFGAVRFAAQYPATRRTMEMVAGLGLRELVL